MVLTYGALFLLNNHIDMISSYRLFVSTNWGPVLVIFIGTYLLYHIIHKFQAVWLNVGFPEGEGSIPCLYVEIQGVSEVWNIIRWEIDDSSDDKSYNDRTPGLFNICEIDDSSDDDSDDISNKFGNAKNNEEWSDKGLDYAKYLSEEENYDENFMTDDEISDWIDEYKMDESYIEGEHKVTVLVCEKSTNPVEETCTSLRIVKIQGESEKAFERVRTATNTKDDRNQQVGELEKWIGDTWEIFHAVGARGGVQNKKEGVTKKYIVVDERKSLWLVVDNWKY